MSLDSKIIVATFYKFVPIADYRELRQPLLDICDELQVRGTILLASEGINATLAGSRKAIDGVMGHLRQDPRFLEMEYKESLNNEMPFYRMKVKLRKEIVSLGVADVNPNKLTAEHVPTEKWDSLISDPEVLVVDVRNKYESDIGNFKNAVAAGTGTFHDFPEYVRQHLDPNQHKKIAMYCTGGIRCEKASAWMLQQGFEQIYQLQGGILRYLEEAEADTGHWHGDCFVFDGRVAVNQVLDKGDYEQCYSCRKPLSAADRHSEKYREGVSCPSCFDTLTAERRASLEERQRQVKLAESRNQQHIGQVQTGQTNRPR